MSKLREHLDDCERYKTFLDRLTPEEYFNDQKNQKYERAKERMESKRGKFFFFFFFFSSFFFKTRNAPFC